MGDWRRKKKTFVPLFLLKETEEAKEKKARTGGLKGGKKDQNREKEKKKQNRGGTLYMGEQNLCPCFF